jgi:hypothetical protein
MECGGRSNYRSLRQWKTVSTEEAWCPEYTNRPGFRQRAAWAGTAIDSRRDKVARESTLGVNDARPAKGSTRTTRTDMAPRERTFTDIANPMPQIMFSFIGKRDGTGMLWFSDGEQ